MHPEEKNLAIADDHVRFLDARPAAADRLHLPALQRDARFQLLFYEVVMKGLLVGDDAHGAVSQVIKVREC
jgi:hypothetical protein